MTFLHFKVTGFMPSSLTSTFMRLQGHFHAQVCRLVIKVNVCHSLKEGKTTLVCPHFWRTIQQILKIGSIVHTSKTILKRISYWEYQIQESHFYQCLFSNLFVSHTSFSSMLLYFSHYRQSSAYMVFIIAQYYFVVSFFNLVLNHSSNNTVFCLNGCFSTVSKNRVSRVQLS